MPDEQRRDETGETLYPDPTAPSDPGGVDATLPLPQTPPPLPLTPPGQPPAAHGQFGQPGRQGQHNPYGPQGVAGGHGAWGQEQGQWGQQPSGQWGQQPQGAYGASTQQGHWGQQPQQGGSWIGPAQPGQPGQPMWGQPMAGYGQPGPGAAAGSGGWGTPPTRTRKPFGKLALGIIAAAVVLGLLLLGVLAVNLVGRQEASAVCTSQQCELTLVRKGATVNLKTAKGDKVLTQQGIDGGTAKYSVDGTQKTCRRGESARVGDLQVTCSAVDGDKLVLTVKN